MRPARGFRSLRRLVVPFLLAGCVLLTGLGWLAWRVLEQDRTLERQRVLDRLAAGADLVAAALAGRLAELDDRLAQIAGTPDPQRSAQASAVVGSPAHGAVILVFERARVEAYPAGALLYYPPAPASPRAPQDAFSRGESLEHQQRDYVAAAAFYRGMAASADRATRAEALVRLARTLRKANRRDDALAVYDQLAQLAPTRVDDVPVDLIAHQARSALFDEARLVEPLRREAAAVRAGLADGRWRLTEGAYRFYAGEATRWLGAGSDPAAPGGDALAIAKCAGALWREWQSGELQGTRAAGRRTAWVEGQPLLETWRGTADNLAVLVASASFLEPRWLSGLKPTLDQLNLQFALADTDGHAVYLAPSGPAAYRVARSSADTGLPWTLHVATADLGADLAQMAARRRLVLAGFGLTAALIAVAGYVIVRGVARELGVARLQSDFVSAVSHEFRTPLATLRQLSEMLADGRVQSEERRGEYYEDLRHESERLHRLVENLLDFGRMEAGRREYRFAELDPSALVRRVAAEFSQEAAADGYRIEVSTDDGGPGRAVVRADEEALSCVLWNLLDNAVKYSPHATTVWVDGRWDGDRYVLSVRDEGLGVATSEQQRIFDKFVRGASATAAGVRGTGLGLAMVKHIVAAHDGHVRVASEEGKGSTFTIELPTVP